MDDQLYFSMLVFSILQGSPIKGRPREGVWSDADTRGCGRGKGPCRRLQASTFHYSSMFCGRPLWV